MGDNCPIDCIHCLRDRQEENEEKDTYEEDFVDDEEDEELFDKDYFGNFID